MMPKIPDRVLFQSTLPQDKALALLLQISRQHLLSPCSHNHCLLYLTYIEGGERCQSFGWEKPETHAVLQMPVFKASSFKQLQPPLPDFTSKLHSISASSKQQEHLVLQLLSNELKQSSTSYQGGKALVQYDSPSSG